MCRRILFLLFIFVTFYFKAFTAVFVVTSNADSGAGTLREALTLVALSDSSQTNYITFNLPDLSESGRTILLLSQLPDVSSNLVIDGSSQPGAAFGISTAKVALFYKTPANQYLSGLRIANKHDVTILGLYIKNLTDVSGLNISYDWRAIDILNSNNIKIGEAGKGNVILGFTESLITNSPPDGGYINIPCRNITIKSSFFNIEPDGTTLPSYHEGPVSLASVAGQINIGGTPDEGNVLGNGLQVSQDNSYAPYDTVSAHFLIKNNKIGVDYFEQKSIPASSGILGQTVDPNGNNYFDVEDNVITAASGYGAAIFFINMGRQINIVRNYIGTDKTLTKKFTTGGLFMYWDTGQVAIGSNNPADANYITNCNPISIWPYTNATVNKNSIYCPVNASTQMHLDSWNGFNYPIIKILNIGPNTISGTATPNSNIELFYSDICKTCSPQTYFASTIADGTGKWKYDGNINGTVIASATINGNTSEFTRTSIDINNLKIINACSNDGLGSIIGAVPNSATIVKWVDEHGNQVGNNADLTNVKAGKYKLIVQNGGCGDSTSYFEIKPIFMIDTSNVVKKQPSCGNANGSITGIYIENNDQGPPNLYWKNESDKVVSRSSYLQDVPAGAYRLIISNTDSSCVNTYGPVILKNTTGPNIDQSTAVKQSTNCGQSTGSITNITVTGTGMLKYIWTNSQQQQIGFDKDLTGQPAGTYKLEVTDETQCGPVYSGDIVIPETNGIAIDESKTSKTAASCGKSNGSVTGITQINGTIFTWTDANNRVVGNTLDLTGVPSGDYTLTVSNAFGCIKTSALYHIDQPLAVIFPAYSFTVKSACFGSANGSVMIDVDALPKNFRWVNSSGQDVGENALLTNAAAGDYQLYLTDNNGCETYYKTYTVPQLPEFTVVESGQATSDVCNIGSGAISSTTVTGGLPPYIYTWFDAGNQPVGTGSSISNLKPGNYTLNIVDKGCGNINISYTISEETTTIVAPSVSDIQLCSSGNALIMVNNVSTKAVYRLYANLDSSAPIAEETGGRFTVSVNGNRSYFISQLNGTCESSRTEVKVTVGLSTVNIANAFTPNGDGTNDYWKINNIENYSGAVVQVFTRYGQKVFESKGYSIPFDGTLNGKKLPAGVYYFIINLNSHCNILSGSLTIIR